jgi:hypothetical protein
MELLRGRAERPPAAAELSTHGSDLKISATARLVQAEILQQDAPRAIATRGPGTTSGPELA